MENKKENLIEFALNDLKKFIFIEEQKWNFFEKQPFFDYRCHFKKNNEIYIGKGVARIQKNALLAAIGESLERFAIHFCNENSSNGIALHSNLELAFKNAKFEFIERHFLMLYSFGHVQSFKNFEFKIPNELQEIINLLNSKKIEVEFVPLFLDNKINVFLCVINGLNCNPPFGLIFGSSCKDNIFDAIEASFTEAIPNVMAFLNSNLIPITEDDFYKINFVTPADHLKLFADFNFGKKYLANRKIKNFVSEKFDLNQFQKNQLQYPFMESFPVIKVTCDDLLSPVFGSMKENQYLKGFENLNFNFPIILA